MDGLDGSIRQDESILPVEGLDGSIQQDESILPVVVLDGSIYGVLYKD